ncbi:MAG: DUF1361 domain-containing protein [Sphingobacteriales bacterium]|nr:DUF1361 domain-containing protein [Sphingobacteriales bacterium]
MTLLKQIRSSGIAMSVSIHHWLLLSSAFSCFLLLGRIIVTDSMAYIFLPWNLFLAFIPYWITKYFAETSSIRRNKRRVLIVVLAWLVFIPNSFYIITDLFHLHRFSTAPKWFDLLLIFSFAWNGIICGILSFRRIEMMLKKARGKNLSFVFIFIVMFLCSFGIYIGRFLRYNSWDVITNPFSLAEEIADMFLHPFANRYVWGMTLCYAVFMTFMYLTIKKLGEFISFSE